MAELIRSATATGQGLPSPRCNRNARLNETLQRDFSLNKK